MKKRGRRTLLSHKLQKQICKLLAQGHTIKTVCEAVGIAERTYYDWQKHPHFSRATTGAIGQSKIFLVEKLRQSDDWRAQAFLLERRWPHEFGRSDARSLPKEPEARSATSSAQSLCDERTVPLRTWCESSDCSHNGDPTCRGIHKGELQTDSSSIWFSDQSQ
jgi:hypothetical protein